MLALPTLAETLYKAVKTKDFTALKNEALHKLILGTGGIEVGSYKIKATPTGLIIEEHTEPFDSEKLTIKFKPDFEVRLGIRSGDEIRYVNCKGEIHRFLKHVLLKTFSEIWKTHTLYPSLSLLLDRYTQLLVSDKILDVNLGPVSETGKYTYQYVTTVDGKLLVESPTGLIYKGQIPEDLIAKRMLKYPVVAALIDEDSINLRTYARVFEPFKQSYVALRLREDDAEIIPVEPYFGGTLEDLVNWLKS